MESCCLRRLALAAVVLTLLSDAAGRAAELTLTRRSRLATIDEILGGAPEGSVIHDLFVTSPSDLLSLSDLDLELPLFQHDAGSDVAAMPSALASAYPAITADSFFTMPGSTVVLGDGFAASRDSLWGDLSDNGPQSLFQFGRLTTPQSGMFSGVFALQGTGAPVSVPFQMQLPDASDPTGLLGEWSASFAYSLDPPRPTVAPPTSPFPPGGPPIAPSLPTVPSLPPVESIAWGSLSLSRGTRLASPDEIAGGVPAGSLVHEFRVTSAADILSIGSVSVTAPLYQNSLGVDHAAPSTSHTALDPALGADSFLTTPGGTLILGDGFTANGLGMWGDLSDDGAQTEFRFAQLTTSSAGEFSGIIALAGPEGPVEAPFSFTLPSTLEEAALLAETPITIPLSYTPAPPRTPASPISDPVLPPTTPAIPPADPPFAIDPLGPVDSPPIDPGPEAIDPLEPPAEQPLDPPTIVELIRDIDFTRPELTFLPWRGHEWVIDRAIDMVEFQAQVDGSWTLVSLPVELTGEVVAYDALVGLAGADGLRPVLFNGAIDPESLSLTAFGRLFGDSLIIAQTAGAESFVPEPTALSLSVVMLAGLAGWRRRPRVA